MQVEDAEAELRSRLQPVTVYVDEQGRINVYPDPANIKVGERVDWLFQGGPLDLMEVEFEIQEAEGGSDQKGPFPRNALDPHNPSPGVYKHFGKGNVPTKPARWIRNIPEEGWKYTVTVTLAGAEPRTLDPLIIVRSSVS